MNIVSKIFSKLMPLSFYTPGPGRPEFLSKVYEIYCATGVPLQASVYSTADDVGLYYYVPLVGALFGMPVEWGTNLFFYGAIGIAYACCAGGLLWYAKTWLTRAMGCLTMLVFTLHVARLTGPYVMYFCTTLVTVPLLLVWYAQKRPRSSWYAVLAFLGAFSAMSDHIRIHASTGALLFFTTLLLLSRMSRRTKVWSALAVMLGYVAVQMHFNHVVRQHYPVGHATQHTIWHTIYCGFGFLASPINPHGLIGTDDSVVVQHMRVCAPGIGASTDVYEQLVKREVMLLCARDWHFVFKTLFAKLGIIFFFLLYYGNIGLLAAYCYRKPWQVDLAFGVALAFNSLFGLLYIPEPYYVLGFISFAALFNIVSICFALDQGALGHMKKAITHVMSRSSARSI